MNRDMSIPLSEIYLGILREALLHMLRSEIQMKNHVSMCVSRLPRLPTRIRDRVRDCFQSSDRLRAWNLERVLAARYCTTIHAGGLRAENVCAYHACNTYKGGWKDRDDIWYLTPMSTRVAILWYWFFSLSSSLWTREYHEKNLCTGETELGKEGRWQCKFDQLNSRLEREEAK